MSKKNIEENPLIWPIGKPLPTMHEVPYWEAEEEAGLPNQFHDLQPHLLMETFFPNNYTQEEIFMGKDMCIFYDLEHTQWYCRPDFFAIVGVDHLYQGQMRTCYTTWNERVNPLIIIEILSASTAKNDLGIPKKRESVGRDKWTVYEQFLEVPYYFVINLELTQFRLFHLEDSHYVEIFTQDNFFFIPEIGLYLGLWNGIYWNIDRLWLRWFDVEKRLILNLSEHSGQERQRAEQESQRAEQERQRAEQERQRAEQESQRAEQAEQKAQAEHLRAEQEIEKTKRLIEKLKAMGIELDE